jgi:hypothetical protein
MELELKHLAAYLPYGLKGLKISKGNFKTDPNIEEIIDLTISDIGAFLKKRYHVISCKPILRPLSKFEYEDLIKVKEHLGLGKWCDAYDQYFDVWFDDVANVDKLILQCPYEITQFFLEWHFDIFGLIDAGLAVEMEVSHGR